VSLSEVEVLSLTNGEVHLNRIQRGYRGDRAAGGTGKGAYLELRLASDAINRSDKAGETKIDFCGPHRRLIGLDLGFSRLHGGFGGEIVLNGIVQVLLAGGLFFGQRSVRTSSCVLPWTASALASIALACANWPSAWSKAA